MKHLKTFKQINEGKSPKKITEEEYNILCMIGDVQHDGEEGVSSESFDKSEYKVVKGLEKDGLVELNDEDLYVLTSDGKKLMKDEHRWDAGEQGPGKQLNKKELKKIKKRSKK